MKANIFNSKMVLHGDTIEILAKVLGINRQTLSMKINGKTEFKRSEIDEIIKRYNLTPEETHEIFFG